MSVQHRILDWITEQQMAGRNPKSIALSPWDYEELRAFVDAMEVTPRSEKLFGDDQIFGLSIITTPK